MENSYRFSPLAQFNYPNAFLVVNRQVIPLVKELTSLGRYLENDVVFHEEFLSRYHAEIVLEGKQFVLYDKNSTGGTFVNGKRVERCVLNSGDLISLVNIQIMFVDNNSSLVGKSTGFTHALGGLPDER